VDMRQSPKTDVLVTNYMNFMNESMVTYCVTVKTNCGKFYCCSTAFLQFSMWIQKLYGACQSNTSVQLYYIMLLYVVFHACIRGSRFCCKV